MNKDKNKISVDIPPINQNRKYLPLKQLQRKEDDRVDITPIKIIEERKYSNLKDEEKVKTIFSLENEIYKVKISLPFSEIIKKYRI